MDLIIRLVMIVMAKLLAPFTPTRHAIQDRLRRIGKQDWPLAEGRIHTVYVGSTDNYEWQATVAYSYSVNGEFWSGEVARRFAFEGQADQYAKAHPSDSRLIVRYAPMNHARSVVLPEDQRTVSMDGTI